MPVNIYAGTCTGIQVCTRTWHAYLFSTEPTCKRASTRMHAYVLFACTAYVYIARIHTLRRAMYQAPKQDSRCAPLRPFFFPFLFLAAEAGEAERSEPLGNLPTVCHSLESPSSSPCTSWCPPSCGPVLASGGSSSRSHCMCVCVCMHACMCLCMYVCMYMCMYNTYACT
jgi:hypothetical protein